VEHVILFAGPMGAGKTTAIRALSEIEVVTTEAANTDRVTADKPTTTVALDYGEISVSDEEKVRLYGIPGQRRFDFMWRILKERAVGMVLLVHNDAPDPVGLMLEFVDEFRELCDSGGAVVGVTRSDLHPGLSLTDYTDALERERPELMLPVMLVDPRDRGHMQLLLMSLIANIEARAMYRAALAAEQLHTEGVA
jgi:signal recognition particle receptor subunit beta